MARTVEEIKKDMTAEFMKMEAVKSRYGLDGSKSFADCFSMASLENIIFYVFAVAVWALEKLFDLHRADVDDMPDGGTMIEATGVTAENRRDKFVAGLIGTHYDMDAQIAVLANGTDTPEHAAELEQFAQVRSSCKAQVDELLARN